METKQINGTSLLDSAAAAHDALSESPAELPRLTTANVFITYGKLGAALGTALEEYKALPEAPPANCTDHLKQLIKSCEGAIKHAARLLEANR